MLRIVFTERRYTLKNYTLSFKQPSPRGTIESLGGFTTTYRNYGDTKETYTIKTNWRKRDTYSLFLNDLYEASSFRLEEYNPTTDQFDLLGVCTFTGSLTDKMVEDKVRKFNHEIQFSCIRVV